MTCSAPTAPDPNAPVTQAALNWMIKTNRRNEIDTLLREVGERIAQVQMKLNDLQYN